jgi:hypothetical protein
MPRHYFNLDDTDHVSDPDGTELRDDTDAMAHATRVMRELMFQRRHARRIVGRLDDAGVRHGRQDDPSHPLCPDTVGTNKLSQFA